MSGFLSPEQIKTIRFTNSKKFSLAEGIDITIIQLSGADADRANAMKKEVEDGKVKQGDFLKYLLQSCCVKPDGERFTKEDAEQVFDVIPTKVFFKLVDEVLITSELKKVADQISKDGSPGEAPAN